MAKRNDSCNLIEDEQGYQELWRQWGYLCQVLKIMRSEILENICALSVHGCESLNAWERELAAESAQEGRCREGELTEESAEVGGCVWKRTDCRECRGRWEEQGRHTFQPAWQLSLSALSSVFWRTQSEQDQTPSFKVIQLPVGALHCLFLVRTLPSSEKSTCLFINDLWIVSHNFTRSEMTLKSSKRKLKCKQLSIFCISVSRRMWTSKIKPYQF